jgi:hypothetical protein
MNITKQMLIDEGYNVNGKLEESIYILKDGTLWDGGFDYGSRCVEHREVEVFTKFDRYDDEFWSTVMNELIMIIPECEEVMILPTYTPTKEQQDKIDQLVKRGFLLSAFK